MCLSYSDLNHLGLFQSALMSGELGEGGGRDKSQNDFMTQTSCNGENNILV